MSERDDKLKAFQKELGEKLKKIRVEKKIKAYELGQTSGVSQPTISVYESGEKWPRLDVLIKICDALDTSLIDLLEGLYNEDAFTAEQLLMISQLKAFLKKSAREGKGNQQNPNS
jgi:transcriptional regulator with XRE-family HTH domain